MDPSGGGKKAKMETIDLERFSGFADIYASVRPQPPQKVTDIALSILGKPAVEKVLDLGSGTGLSTVIWQHVTKSLIGIEPTPDMRSQAQKDFPNISFQDGNSYSTNLPTESIDIVSCSQSFHWMEPQSTLLEVNRILKPVGLFVVYDCIWPVTWDWSSECQYRNLLQKAKSLASQNQELAESSKQYPKDRHLFNIEQSGYFSYCGSIYFDNEEVCDSNRFVGIALSQGLIQVILRKDNRLLSTEIDKLRKTASLVKKHKMRVSYVMNYGVKSGI